MTNKILSVLVGLNLLATAFLGFVTMHPTDGRGGTSNADAIALDSSLSVGTTLTLGTTVSGVLGASSGITVSASTGTCADATTTLFAIVNPYTSTSTFQVVRLNGQTGTTTVDILVGTSTTAYAPVNANLTSPSAIKAQVVATSTQFFLAQDGGSNDVYSPGTSNSVIVVGPNQYALAQATSSYSGSSATGNQGITNTNNSFSCTYEGIWYK